MIRNVHDKLIRGCDLALAIITAPLIAPLSLVIAIVIKLDNRGPVLFFQERLGKDERPFRLIKFRSMVVDAEASGPRWAADNDQRVTRVGRFLRASRLDELPQWINIICGDLSFVGPRPIRADFADILARHDSRYRQRFKVKPGLTGWAQLYAPYGSSIEEQMQKLPYDLRYPQEGLTVLNYFHLITITGVRQLHHTIATGYSALRARRKNTAKP